MRRCLALKHVKHFVLFPDPEIFSLVVVAGANRLSHLSYMWLSSDIWLYAVRSFGSSPISVWSLAGS